jgi:hypothetical protein
MEPVSLTETHVVGDLGSPNPPHKREKRDVGSDILGGRLDLREVEGIGELTFPVAMEELSLQAGIRMAVRKMILGSSARYVRKRGGHCQFEEL